MPATLAAKLSSPPPPPPPLPLSPPSHCAGACRCSGPDCALPAPLTAPLLAMACCGSRSWVKCTRTPIWEQACAGVPSASTGGWVATHCKAARGLRMPGQRLAVGHA